MKSHFQSEIPWNCLTEVFGLGLSMSEVKRNMDEIILSKSTVKG